MNNDFEYDYKLLPNMADIFIQYAYRNPDKYNIRVNLYDGEVVVFEKETGENILNFFDGNLASGRGNTRILKFRFNDCLYEIYCKEGISDANSFNLNTEEFVILQFGAVLNKFYEFLLSIDNQEKFEWRKWQVA